MLWEYRATVLLTVQLPREARGKSDRGLGVFGIEGLWKDFEFRV